MDKINQYLENYDITPLQAEILATQKLNESQIQQILFPQLESELLSSSEVEAIINRLEKAKIAKEKLVIIGDYDADGICATTILVDALQQHGVECGFYIPNRLEDGYGLSVDILEQVHQKGYSLIITVDNGVSAIEALEYAKAKNMEVIVTDHHIIPGNYEYDFLLHPTKLDQKYQSMCGAGVSLYLARNLLQDQNVDFYYVLAMIATIADMMPVFDENRVIIQKGLAILNDKRYLTIESLLDNGIKNINEMDIAYQVVPKINTLGRLSDRSNANNLVRYFRMKEAKDIMAVATQINELNKERKKLTTEALNSIKEIEKLGCLHFVLSDDIHEGVLGLVANKLVSEVKEPVLVLTSAGDSFRGSGRSPENFDIHVFLAELQVFLEAFGGHKNACGFDLKKEQLSAFKEAIRERSKGFSTVEKVDEPQYISLEANALDFDVFPQIEQLRPYGIGFMQPKFKITRFPANRCSKIKDRFTKWQSTIPFLEAIYFRDNCTFAELEAVKYIDFIGNLQLNEFRGTKKIVIIVEAI